MHIVYLLKNIDKDNYPNRYIGSKSECKVIAVEGLSTIISTKTGKPYLGSSSNPEMKQDLKSGHRFEAEILASVDNRSLLRKTEEEILLKNDAANNEKFYNMTNNTLSSSKASPDAIGNLFGENIKFLASERSSMAKRDNRARQSGFDNYGEMYLYIYKQHLSGKSYTEISMTLGQERHFASRYLNVFDMGKCVSEVETKQHLAEEARSLWWKGATLSKICEILNLEKPTVRLFIGKFSEDKAFGVSKLRNKTKEELEIEITKLILDGKDFCDVAEETGIVLESVKRYFFRCIRSRLKSCDL